LGATPREICYSFVAQPIKRKNLFCCTAAILLLTSLTFLVHLHEQGALRWAKIPNLCFVARVASVEDEESAAADPAAAVVAAAAQQQQLLSCSTSTAAAAEAVEEEAAGCCKLATVLTKVFALSVEAWG
jgi:hypothetical protein